MRLLYKPLAAFIVMWLLFLPQLASADGFSSIITGDWDNYSEPIIINKAVDARADKKAIKLIAESGYRQIILSKNTIVKRQLSQNKLQFIASRSFKKTEVGWITI